MNRHQLAIQCFIGHLGDHVGHVQMLMRCLAECRQLEDAQLDPETDLAVICYLEEAADILKMPRYHLRERHET
jgi:hypothetical protein